MKIALFVLTEKIAEYESLVVPNVGDAVLLSDKSIFKVEQRVFPTIGTEVTLFGTAKEFINH